jgi:enoyl-CoA hydratase/carnithine racemase
MNLPTAGRMRAVRLRRPSRGARMSVRFEVEDRVGVVTIDRPDRRNAMDVAVFEGLADAADQARVHDDVGAVLVRGEGGTFSSGIDVSVLGEQATEGARVDESFITRLQDAFTAFEELDVPTLAAIEGPCFGAGLQLALACHLRAVAPDASMSIMETRWALIPDLGGTYRLPRLVGLGRATELTLTARRVAADEAVRIGLAEVRFDDLEGAHALARRLASGPGAVRRAPRLLRENLDRDRTVALAAERAAQLECIAGPDFAEAVAAEIEGREPRYVGT